MLVRREKKHNAIISKARHSLSINKEHLGPSPSKESPPPLVRSMSAKSNTSLSQPPVAASQPVIRVKSASSSTSFPKRIQQAIAKASFENVQLTINSQQRQAQQNQNQNDQQRKARERVLLVRRRQESDLASKLSASSKKQYSSEQIELMQRSAAERVYKKRQLVEEESRKKEEEALRKSQRFDNFDLEKMRELANARAMDAQIQMKKEREKNECDADKKKNEKSRKLEEERVAKSKKRAEVYAINKVLRDAFEVQFAEFVAEKSVASTCHSVVGKEDAALVEKHEARFVGV
ncbi:hypothetical protein ScalyP_jg3319 [Parmales sp. scaly parma]|nr:hypothetical protein ScalyP_jg3319 [Parmales sp. scaly parma]